VPARSVASAERLAHSAPPEARVPRVPSEQEFLDRYGDAIDDRVAEILDELLTERRLARATRRPTFLLITASLLLAAVAAVILLHP
jgi:hypothetical protein